MPGRLAAEREYMDHREFVRRKQLDALPYVVSPELGMRFQVDF